MDEAVDKVAAWGQIDNQTGSSSLSGQPEHCESCGNSFEPRKHGGGSPKRFCSQACRMAWHSARRNPACTLVAALTVPSPQGGQRNAPENKLKDTDWKYRDGGVVSKGLETALYQNARGDFLIQYVLSNAFIDALVSELAAPSLRETNED